MKAVDDNAQERMSGEFESRLELYAEGFSRALFESQSALTKKIEQSTALQWELAATRQHVTERDEEISRLTAIVEARDGELRKVYASLSWRITRPLRLAKSAPRRLRIFARSSIDRGSTFFTRVARAAQRHAVPWVMRRPRLVAILRRTVAAHPRLREFIKRRVGAFSDKARARDPRQASVGLEIPPGAVRILKDLERGVGPRKLVEGTE